MSTRRKMLDLVEAQVVEGYRNGSTLRELAKVYEVSAGTVRNLLKESGVPMRTRGRRRVQINAGDPIVEDVNEDVVLTETNVVGA